MTQENAAQRLYNRFRDAGMTDAGALGVLLNLWAESLLRSNNVEDRSGIPDDLYTGMVDAGGYDFATDNGKHYGYGLAQWTLPSRKTSLLKYAILRGVSVADEAMQADFLLQELTSVGEYAALWQLLRTTNSVQLATDAFQRTFERPAQIIDRTVFLPDIEAMLAEGSDPDGFWPPRILTAGMEGPDVYALQGLLYAHGWYYGAMTGVMDEGTLAAAAAFKTAEGLGKPETFGNKAWARLLRR